jgi:hypothetical protein
MGLDFDLRGGWGKGNKTKGSTAEIKIAAG